MERSNPSEDKRRYAIVAEELARVQELIKGHEKLLAAIAKL